MREELKKAFEAEGGTKRNARLEQEKQSAINNINNCDSFLLITAQDEPVNHATALTLISAIQGGHNLFSIFKGAFRWLKESKEVLNKLSAALIAEKNIRLEKL